MRTVWFTVAVDGNAMYDTAREANEAARHMRRQGADVYVTALDVTEAEYADYHME